MEKLDLRKQYKYLYNPSAKMVVVVDVPPLQFAMVDGFVRAGEGPGDSTDFQEAVSALYGISYTLKFMFKKREDNPIDYPVMALEGLWMTDSGSYNIFEREALTYTVMIMQPEIVTESIARDALWEGKVRASSAVIAADCRYVALVTSNLCMALTSQFVRMNSVASQSSSSGCVGHSPCWPKSSVVMTRPFPK